MFENEIDTEQPKMKAAWNYEAIKTLAKETGCTVKDLIALAPQNDPFYCGTDSDLALGNWFADLWRRFGYEQGVHIRRVHYQIISQDPPVTLPNGTPYENTENCWKTLNQASKDARYLGLVDPGAFVDRRNPQPHLYRQNGWSADPSLEVQDNIWDDSFSLPDLPDLPGFKLYNYSGKQRFHLEVWCEKSTMDDVLLPLCEQYGVNLVTGVGEMSITSCLALTRRQAPDHPLRILYVSDFDPAGQSMPVAVARKVEYFLRNADVDANVRLFPLVLTAEQVQSYRLPRTPIKDTEARAGRFEERYGEGAVELDALEALHPGVLHRIVQREIQRYYDRGLIRRVDTARAELDAELDRIRQAIIDAHEDDLAPLRAEYARIRAEFEAQIGAVQDQVTRIWQAISEKMEEEVPDLDDYPVPEAEEGNERDDVLYDSQRDYETQIDAYKVFQGKLTA